MSTPIQESDDNDGNDHEQAGVLCRDVTTGEDRDHLVGTIVQRLAAMANEQRAAATEG